MGGSGAELGGLLGRAAGLQTRCQEFYTRGRDGGRARRRSCLPVAVHDREYQECFHLLRRYVCCAGLSLNICVINNYSLNTKYIIFIFNPLKTHWATSGPSRHQKQCDPQAIFKGLRYMCI